MRRAACLLILALGTGPAGAEDPAPPTPAAERFGTIAADAKREQERFSSAYAAAKTAEERQSVIRANGNRSARDYAGAMLALVREFPKDAAAFDVFLWQLEHDPAAGQTTQVADLILEQFATSEGLANLCARLTRTPYQPAALRLLRGAMATSPHRIVRAHACYSLAVALAWHAEGYAGKGWGALYEREAERLLLEVVEKYAEFPHHTTLGAAAERHLFELRYLTVGKTAPEIVGVDLAGKPLKLSDYRGKVVLLTFTATWCGPCMADIPLERKLVMDHEDEPFAVLGVNGDPDPAAAALVYRRLGVPWRLFADGGDSGPISTRWNVRSWPTVYLLDADGVIRAKGVALSGYQARTDAEGKVELVRTLAGTVAKLVAETEAQQPQAKP